MAVARVGDGKAILPFYGQPHEVLVQPDGKIVAGSVGDSDSTMVVTRLNAGGTLDGTFGA